MEKQQGKGIVLKDEIKKERVANYPFYLISTTYSHEPDYHFLIVVDYSLENTILTIYPFTKDMSRLPICSITLADILTRKAVTALHVNLLRYKVHPQSVTILEAEFVLGHRSGQLAVIQYKDKKCKVIQRLNKALKEQGILNKTASLLFGNGQSYTPFFKEPIKAFQAYPTHPDLRYSYQVGNTIIFMRDLNESQQFAFFSIYETNNAESYAFRYDLATIAEKNTLCMYGTEDYYALKDSSRKITLLKFEHEVSSYACLAFARKEIAVALSMKQQILLIETNKFTLKTKVQTSMSIRRLSCFTHCKDQYIAIMVYDNYVLLYNVDGNKFCKLTGHRSFVATALLDEQEQMVVSAGMDHRISLVGIDKIKESNWVFLQKDEKIKRLDDQECQAFRFPDIFSLGQYNNVRTNLHSYGYGDFLMLNKHYCLMTYDAKVVIYKYA